jgi:hypothetical protein
MSGHVHIRPERFRGSPLTREYHVTAIPEVAEPSRAGPNRAVAVNSHRSSLIMADIEIFLVSREAQVPFKFLSIPRSDIERLAVLPFRWIRYVMFAICGARGDLSTTPRGPPVDYDRTEFADGENTYYYWPSGELSFCV